ncbi:MAG TPA: tetratricopeptide repeat protein [Bryobacteraceae bacterium]|nr:tetratricopeptide repeat protein [Bryobacteraceae bacterium]
MTRISFLVVLCLLCAGLGHSAEVLQLDANENLFYVMATINAAGYDEGVKLPDNSPLRAQLRDYLAKQNIPVLPELKQFYRRHMAKPGPQAGVQDLSQYISWALSVTGPPEFGWRTRDVEVPPDAKALEGFQPLMIDFCRQAHLEELWQRVRPAYEKELEKYHEPVLKTTNSINGYLRVAAGGYLGRRFQLFIELLAEPEQVQTRNYGDDAFVIATPSEQPRMFDIRHAYLHFQIDPIVIKYGVDLQQKRSLLDLVQLAPIDQQYKDDFVLLAGESLIKAVECRLDKNKAGIEQAMRQGYVLTQYFSEQLPVFEQQQQGMRFYAEEMFNGIDLKHESARISAVKFDAGQLQRKARQVAVAGPELSPSARTLEKAEDLYTKKSLNEARTLFLKSLEQQGSQAEHAQAWYGLARIATLENQPDAAVKLFEKTLGASPDGFTKGWTFVYLARLARAANELEKATKFYQDALSVPGASERAMDAARKESQNISKNQEISK